MLQISAAASSGTDVSWMSRGANSGHVCLFFQMEAADPSQLSSAGAGMASSLSGDCGTGLPVPWINTEGCAVPGHLGIGTAFCHTTLLFSLLQT